MSLWIPSAHSFVLRVSYRRLKKRRSLCPQTRCSASGWKTFAHSFSRAAADESARRGYRFSARVQDRQSLFWIIFADQEAENELVGFKRSWSLGGEMSIISLREGGGGPTPHRLSWSVPTWRHADTLGIDWKVEQDSKSDLKVRWCCRFLSHRYWWTNKNTVFIINILIFSWKRWLISNFYAFYFHLLIESQWMTQVLLEGGRTRKPFFIK